MSEFDLFVTSLANSAIAMYHWHPKSDL